MSLLIIQSFPLFLSRPALAFFVKDELFLVFVFSLKVATFLFLNGRLVRVDGLVLVDSLLTFLQSLSSLLFFFLLPRKMVLLFHLHALFTGPAVHIIGYGGASTRATIVGLGPGGLCRLTLNDHGSFLARVLGRLVSS